MIRAGSISTSRTAFPSPRLRPSVVHAGRPDLGVLPEPRPQFRAPRVVRAAPQADTRRVSEGALRAEDPGIAGRDPRLDRLLVLSDGVFAISLTLLAYQLVPPAVTGSATGGGTLLSALVAMWPDVLSYMTSFTMVAVLWQAHHRLFLEVRRFDGVLMWLVLFQLGLVAFLPFPTAVLGGHVADVVAEEFYFGSLLLTSLLWLAVRLYATGGRRLVGSSVSAAVLRRHARIAVLGPTFLLVILLLIPLGVSQVVNALVLGYALALVYVVVSILDWRRGDAKTDPELTATPDRAAGDGRAGSATQCPTCGTRPSDGPRSSSR